MPEEQQRWYAIKIFERDDKVLEQLKLPEEVAAHIEKDIQAAEKELDDDAESIITNERYVYIASVIKSCYKKKSKGKLSVSDKIDRVVTNRFAALPIFAVIMFIVYFVSVTTVGTFATDWANDGVFGEGWHLFGIGSSAAEEASGEYADALNAAGAFVDLDPEAEGFDAAAALAELKAFAPSSENAAGTVTVVDEETLAETDMTVYYSSIPDAEKGKENVLQTTYLEAVAYFESAGFAAPDPADYGVWVPGIPVLIENGLDQGPHSRRYRRGTGCGPRLCAADLRTLHFPGVP